MTKSKQTEAVETTPATLPSVITSENIAQTFDAMETAEDSQFSEIVDKKHLEFEEGEVWNLAFLGITEMTFSEGEEKVTKEVAEFTDKEGIPYYNGNAYLLNRLKSIKCPNLVRIVCTGEERSKSGAGKFKTFKILYAVK